MSWLRNWLFARPALCDHVWVAIGAAYSPPRIRDAMDLTWLEPGVERERALHGCTSFLRRCEKCHAQEITVLLGEAVQPKVQVVHYGLGELK